MKEQRFQSEVLSPYNSFFPHKCIKKHSISCHRCLRNYQEKKKVNSSSEFLSVASRAHPCLMQTAQSLIPSMPKTDSEAGNSELQLDLQSSRPVQTLLSNGTCIFSQAPLLIFPALSSDSKSLPCNVKNPAMIPAHQQ